VAAAASAACLMTIDEGRIVCADCVDAGLAADGGGTAADASSPCVPGAHAFCDDFERPDVSVLAPWDEQRLTSGSALSIVPGGAGTGSRCLRADLPREGTAYLQGKILLGASGEATRLTSARLVVDLRIDLVTGGTVQTAKLNFGTADSARGPSYLYALLSVTPGGELVAEFSGSVAGAEAWRQHRAPYVPGQWHHADLAIDFVRGETTFTLDRVPIAGQGAALEVRPRLVDVVVGAVADPSERATISFDDAQVDLVR